MLVHVGGKSWIGEIQNLEICFSSFSFTVVSVTPVMYTIKYVSHQPVYIFEHYEAELEKCQKQPNSIIPDFPTYLFFAFSQRISTHQIAVCDRKGSSALMITFNLGTCFPFTIWTKHTTVWWKQ